MPDLWHRRAMIVALGAIHSGRAAPLLTAMRDTVAGWHDYYATVVALRHIGSRELNSTLRSALDSLRSAKYRADFDSLRLVAAAKTVAAHLNVAMPDVFDIVLWAGKG